MPTKSKHAVALVDTSVAVPLVLREHEHHRAVIEAVSGRRLGLAGHAAFEAYSVLTRLPPPNRSTPGTVKRLFDENFPESRFLSPESSAALLGRIAELEIAGGAVYDALIAGAALDHRTVLLTCDRRALPTYRKLDVELELLLR